MHPDQRLDDLATTAEASPAPVVEAVGLDCRFGDVTALEDVAVRMHPGEVRALLGDNGAGKTTFLRVVAGLLEPTAGKVRVLDRVPDVTDRDFTSTYGYVPSGTRSFYLRLSALENLVFFGRLEGLTRRAAIAAAWEQLALVGLTEMADRQVGLYSQGMQRRLALARALLREPLLLILDEVTHDLDPDATDRVRTLVRGLGDAGSTVLWATQRVDEIRGFADTVTVLHDGRVAFDGTVNEMIAGVHTQRFLVRIRNGSVGGSLARGLGDLIGGRGQVEPTTEPEQYLVSLMDDMVLGDALGAFTSAGYQVLACREQRSVIETALRHARGVRVP